MVPGGAGSARASPVSPVAGGAEGLGRKDTYRSTLSRGSTLRRGGAFANGAALQGQGLNETYGREDLHERTTLADRSLVGAGAAGAAMMGKISASEGESDRGW
jgi:hypothetical protein